MTASLGRGWAGLAGGCEEGDSERGAGSAGWHLERTLGTEQRHLKDALVNSGHTL